MSLISRIYTTVSSRVDRAVSEIENHDAVIESAIRDNQRSLAAAKVRFSRMQADGRRLRQRLGQMQAAERQWSERARKSADEDEPLALRCLGRRRACRQQMSTLENALREHDGAENRLSGDIAAVEKRLREVTQQRNLMKTRESTAEAMRTFHAIRSSCSINIDDSFEKWETRVLEAELAAGGLEETDELAERFLEEEEIEDLRFELDEIRREEHE